MKLLPVTGAIACVLFGSMAARSDERKSSAEPGQVKTGHFVYKEESHRTLTIYFPDDWKATDKRPALVIFRCRIPEQREHFRRLGMVIVKPLLAGVNSGKLPGMSLDEIAKAPKPRNQVEDTKSAIRWLRSNAEKLGIDPQRIVATGTSGGGDLALQSFINKEFEDPHDNRSVPHRPNALVLYCPAFDGIDIWFVKSELLLNKVNADAPSFVPLVSKFVKDIHSEYATPIGHRADLIQLAEKLGAEKGIDESEIKQFQQILQMFNERDWQLLHPAEDARQMSASRILTNDPLPPTLIMFGTRDHLFPYQQAFIERARSLGQRFTLKVFEGGGHSFMMQPAFMEPSTREAETFLRSNDLIDQE